jgi:nicotinate-nucleotide pyrophosphorylase (carboxylating)
MNTHELIENIIDLALLEDGADVTSSAVFSPKDQLSAVFIAKEDGIIAGLDVVHQVFHRVNPEIVCVFNLAEGSSVKKGDVLGSVQGDAVGILKAERVALNFLQRMSGIATTTAEYIRRIQDTKARILDTRKTAPGQRILDKMAVRTGGGENHRMGLYDMALIKDNHIDRVGSIEEAVNKVRSSRPGIFIEVEARSLDDVHVLMELGVDRIMLDNFSLEDMERAVEMVGHTTPLEASGGITLETVRDVALTGVDYISVGDITHSVKSLDISLLIEGAS